MKHLIKSLLRESLLNDSIGWEPLMTEEEAMSWNSNSVYKDFVYHRTFNRNKPTLYTNGFQHNAALSHKREYTPCIFHFSSEPDNMSVSYGDVVLKCAINVKNPISYNDWKGFVSSDEVKNKHSLRVLGKEYNPTKLTQDELIKLATDKDYSIAINDLMCDTIHKSNYDSFVAVPHDIMVFDPKNIVITTKTEAGKERIKKLFTTNN